MPELPELIVPPLVTLILPVPAEKACTLVATRARDHRARAVCHVVQSAVATVILPMP